MEYKRPYLIPPTSAEVGGAMANAAKLFHEYKTDGTTGTYRPVDIDGQKYAVWIQRMEDYSDDLKRMQS